VLAHLHDADIAPSAPRHDPSHPPEPGHPMPATDTAFAREQGPHLSSAVGFARLLMEDAHPIDEPLVGLCACARPTPLPGIEPTPIHLQHSTHGCHTEFPVMRLQNLYFTGTPWQSTSRQVQAVRATAASSIAAGV
jgi:hypothetical protein